jgi:hypothetical protein
VKVIPATRTAVDHLVKRHYLHCWPAITVGILGLFEDWEAKGVIVFALGPREIEKRYGVTCWELARLYLIDELPKNSESWFIAQAIRWMKKTHPEIRCLVSYADPGAMHRGTIYKASNWIEDGRTDEERKNPRCDYEIPSISLFGPLALRISRRSHIPEHTQHFSRVQRTSKYRFVYWLDSTHEQRRQARYGTKRPV